MACRFRGCTTICAVTVVACIGSAGIMNPATTDKGCSGVACMAIQSGYQVRRVGLGIFADCRSTIMTGLTIVHDAGMIKYSASESTGVVTQTAILTGW